MKLKYLILLTLFGLFSLENVFTGKSLSANDSLEEKEVIKPSQIILRSTPTNSAFYSQPVTFVANVVSTYLPAPNPTGTVEFRINKEIVDRETLINGRTKFTTASIPASALEYYINALYSGDEKYAASGDYLSLMVFPAHTLLNLTYSSNPSSWGNATSFFVSLESMSPATATPEGSVQFKIDEKFLGQVNLDANGRAVFSTSDLPAGNHKMEASYQGHQNFQESRVHWIQEVKKADTTTFLTSSHSTSTFGQEIQYLVTVLSEKGTPTGIVYFQVDGNFYGHPQALDSTGKASITLKNLAVGNHVMKADYVESINFASSNALLHQRVNKAESQTSLLSSANPSKAGEHVLFTAKVTPHTEETPGKIQFKVDGENFSVPVKLDASGQASLIISNLTVGKRKVEAEYTGDKNFNASIGSHDQQVEQVEEEKSKVEQAVEQPKEEEKSKVEQPVEQPKEKGKLEQPVEEPKEDIPNVIQNLFLSCAKTRKSAFS